MRKIFLAAFNSFHWGCRRVFNIFLVMTVLWIGDQNLARANEPSRADVVATDLRFPEGTIFVGDKLYFVDYAQSSVLRLTDGKAEVIWHQTGCGANGLVAVPAGLLVACFDSGTLVEISIAGTILAAINQDDQGHALVAPNDLTADRKGGVYFSASGSSTYPGKVFHLSADHRVVEVASGVSFANGVGISPDGSKLYVAESPTGKILAFPIEVDESLGPSRDLIQLRNGIAPDRNRTATPDSLRVDAHGNLFVALYDGGGVAVVSPVGRLITVVVVPGAHHTNLGISPDGKSLYVTAIDDDPETTYRGRIVRVANPLAP